MYRSSLVFLHLHCGRSEQSSSRRVCSTTSMELDQMSQTCCSTECGRVLASRSPRNEQVGHNRSRPVKSSLAGSRLLSCHLADSKISRHVCYAIQSCPDHHRQ